MENAFDLLEDKVRRAAEQVRKLRQDKRGLEEQAQQVRAQLQAAEKRLAALEEERAGSAEQDKLVEGLQREVKSLHTEREQVRTRVAKLVALLEELD